MGRRKFKVGDIVEVTRYTPAHNPEDSPETEALFRRMVGRRYEVLGFDEYGHIELHPTPKDWIWIKPDDVKKVPERKKKRK